LIYIYYLDNSRILGKMFSVNVNTNLKSLFFVHDYILPNTGHVGQ